MEKKDNEGSTKANSIKEIDISNIKENWQYLEHKGCIFPEEFKPYNINIKYNGHNVPLDTFQQEIALYWTQTLDTDWEIKTYYKQNFSKLFLDTFVNGNQMDFDKFDFTKIKKYIEKEKEKKKNIDPEEKRELRETKEKRNKDHSIVLYNNYMEKMGNFTLENPTLFKGRGDHPLCGVYKAKTLPYKITLNTSKDAPIPKLNIPGYNWGEITNDPKVSWLMSFEDGNSERKSKKYIALSENSKVKTDNDIKKYENARKLKDYIDNIKKDYIYKMEKGNEYERQLGTASYIINHLAIRAGNEKGKKEADTVGCCNLRVEHIKLEENNFLTLDFLGKDSMRYLNTVQIEPLAYENLKRFIKNKDIKEDIFDKINTLKLNVYLQSLMKGLTAKVFRTFNASSTLEKELNKFDTELRKNKLSLDQKVELYNKANKEVAVLCNHQKTVGKNYDSITEKNENLLEDIKVYLKELKKHKKLIKKGKEGLKDKLSKLGLKKKFPNSENSIKTQIEKIETKISKLEHSNNNRKETKNLAFGTSKKNYNDPRISVSFCKKYDIPIENIFTPTLLNKFTWAMNSSSKWKF